MAGVTAIANTFNCPNYVGQIFAQTPSDTPFLAAIGGLTGGEEAQAVIFPWQTYDLRAAGQNTRLEGADAPDAETRVRGNADNVLQIHQEAIGVSYTKLAAVRQYDSTGSTHAGAVGLGVQNPVTNESVWQLDRMLEQIGRDIEYSFIRGAFANPATNATARQTRGILEAITSNVVANSPDAALTEAMILDLMQTIWEAGGIQVSETRTIIVNAGLKRDLTTIFVTGKNYEEASRNVAGVNVMTIETDFGLCNIMLNRYMPTDELAVVSLEMCAPVFLRIPDKGFLFVEPLAKTGATDRSQIYGEIGLKYGNEMAHGKITGLIPTTVGS